MFIHNIIIYLYIRFKLSRDLSIDEDFETFYIKSLCYALHVRSTTCSLYFITLYPKYINIF